MIRLLALMLLLPLHAAASDPPAPATVAVVYNSEIDESKKLAIAYAEARNVPLENLVGLALPDKEEISREEYDTLIRGPLTAEFDRRQWWKRGPDDEGDLQMQQTRIQILVCMRGVPSRIQHPNPVNPDGSPLTQQQGMMTRKAAVDSELALLGSEGHSLDGALANPYFKKDSPITKAGMPILLVGRIDAHSFPVCHRMIQDAVETEKTGLWGFGVIDVANKIPQGDLWLQTAARALDREGIPTLVDRSNDTLPINFPLKDTAIYLGWYDFNVSGPFKNPGFKFKRGAVAAHLHSFSARQLRDAGKNWCAPLLARGACATIGNTFEPWLHMTHNFDVFAERLLAGYTLVEAAYMSIPVLSWQGVVLGDPLYRPFLHLDGSGTKADDDRLFRAFRISMLRWPNDEAEREKQLRAAAARMEDGRLLEALGLNLASNGQESRAGSVFRDAKLRFDDDYDKLRMDLYVAMLDREAKRTAAAIQGLRVAKATYASLPESKATEAWLNILDPPPPPPVQPKAR
ncbi:hypothetical protein HAHE_28400 [Haloferula helveola]|uniref:TIGR03790 family protein n=1 Tax=Haloferula helveola TaxID=490095 RepID=A0ABM7REE1_9BACT|nr:hypothetical protein HAHE_28400 [Haloferula helveola]